MARFPSPRSKLPPLTDAEIRQMRRDGEHLSDIMKRAYLRNGMGRAQVRAVLSGEG